MANDCRDCRHVADAGRAPAICSSISRITWPVRSSDAESGSCTPRANSPCPARDESLGRADELVVGHCQQSAVDHQHQHADVQQLADDPGVDAGEDVERAIEQARRPRAAAVDRPAHEGTQHDCRRHSAASDPCSKPRRRNPNASATYSGSTTQPSQPPATAKASQGSGGVGFEPRGRSSSAHQRRAERQRVERRDDRRHRDRQRELPKELAGDAADERARHEHRAEHQAHGDHRARHLPHGQERGLARRLCPLRCDAPPPRPPRSRRPRRCRSPAPGRTASGC